MKTARAATALVFIASLIAELAWGQRPFAGGPRRPSRPLANRQTTEALSVSVPADAGSRDAPLLFCVGLHIEPLGAEVSANVPGQAGRPKRPRREADATDQPPMGGGRPPLSYHIPQIMRMHTESIRRLDETVRRCGGVITVQAQTPFTKLCVEQTNAVLAEIKAHGHELALHFHEQPHLGFNCDDLPASVWTAVMKEEMAWIQKACPSAKIRYWSGGNNYPQLLAAASGAGLDVMSDHKNPHRQKTFPELLAIHPWRPAGGPTEDSITAFAQHDPTGRIVYLPDGIFTDGDFRARKQRGDAAYLDAITEGLILSLRAARPDRVNVFHITVHPMEISDALFGQWLDRVIVPLVKAGKVQWATYSQMADAFRAWEQAHPGADPRGGPATATTVAPPAASQPSGFMNFVVNVHDFTRLDDSADTLLKLVDIFKRNQVKADFYFTGPYVQVCAEKRPDVIRAIREAGMGIGYHTRPPHPISGGYEGALKTMNDDEAAAELRRWETQAMDLATAKLIAGRSGGYQLVKDSFGTAPVCVSPLAGNPRFKRMMLQLLAGMGAKMVVQYHESGTDLEHPYQWMEGLLARPSDFSITRWPGRSETEESFWWNRLGGPNADPVTFDPVAKLKAQLAAWRGNRAPFITALIHDSDLKYSGGPGWQTIYAGPNRRPKAPPYDLKAPDRAQPRSAEERELILKNYAALVAYAAANLRVVTAADIVALANADRASRSNAAPRH